MKKCEEVREMLSSYLDNELHENDRKQVVSHLESCYDCKAELERLKSVLEVIGEIEEVDLPADFGNKLHEKLVQANQEGKSKRVNKTNVFMWASSMVAGFVLLFAVVNSSYFGSLLQYSNKSKTAYVNDAQLNMVSKQAMDEAAQKQEVAGKNTNQNATASKSMVASADKSVTQPRETVTASSKVIDGGNDKVAAATVPDDSTANTQNTVTLFNVADSSIAAGSTASINAADIDEITPAKVNSLTLAVKDVSEASAQLNDIAKQNGGSVQTPQVSGIMATRSISETENLTLQIPSSEYDKVMDSINKIGTVQVQPQIESSSVQMKSAPAQTKSNEEETDMITVEIIIQQNK